MVVYRENVMSLAGGGGIEGGVFALQELAIHVLMPWRSNHLEVWGIDTFRRESFS